MKIHVEFNSIAEMVNFGKFVGNDLVQAPVQAPKRDKNLPMGASSWEQAYKGTNANLERAYERLREFYDNPKIKEVIEREEHKKIDAELAQAKKERDEAIWFDDRFSFTQRAVNVFKCANIKTLKDLLNCTEDDLMRQPNMGKLTMKDIKAELAKHNFKLKRPSKK